MRHLLDYRSFEWWQSKLAGKNYADALAFTETELKKLPPDVENMIWGGTVPATDGSIRLAACAILGADGIVDEIDLSGHDPQTSEYPFH